MYYHFDHWAKPKKSSFTQLLNNGFIFQGYTNITSMDMYLDLFHPEMF